MATEVESTGSEILSNVAPESKAREALEVEVFLTKRRLREMKANCGLTPNKS